jgi:hypothetical protein
VQEALGLIPRPSPAKEKDSGLPQIKQVSFNCFEKTEYRQITHHIATELWVGEIMIKDSGKSEAIEVSLFRLLLK